MRLVLMRHAKSSWDNLMLQDHDRPLNERGKQACKDVATELKKRDIAPDAVFASTAERCVQTWEYLGLAAGFTAPVTYFKRLYHATADQMLDTAQEAIADTVLMIGHNPGISEFAQRLVGESAPLHAEFGRYPTAAVTIIDFAGNDAGALKFGDGTCAGFFVPKDLISQV